MIETQIKTSTFIIITNILKIGGCDLHENGPVRPYSKIIISF